MDSLLDIDTSFNPGNHGDVGTGNQLSRVVELRQPRIFSALQTRATPATSISCLLITEAVALSTTNKEKESTILESLQRSSSHVNVRAQS